MCKTLEREGERLYCRMDGSASEDEAWDGSPAPLRHSLSWKEYFGSSIDLTPTLMTIYDNYVTDTKDDNRCNKPATELSSIARGPSGGSNANYSLYNGRSSSSSVSGSSQQGKMTTQERGINELSPLRAHDNKKRPLSVSSTSSSASSTSSLPRQARKRVAGGAAAIATGMQVSQSGGGAPSSPAVSSLASDILMDTLTDEESLVDNSGQCTETPEKIPYADNETDSPDVSICVTPKTPKLPETPNSKQLYIHRVVTEIIETERTYVKDLLEIIEGYLSYIVDSPELELSAEDVNALFGNIEDIHEFNKAFLEELEDCEYEPVRVAQCFVDKTDGFKIYTEYCTNYPRSVAVLTECMREPKTSESFRNRQMALHHALPLGSYLLKPVQRVLKYHLLLQNIVGSFEKDHAEYHVITEALSCMTSMAGHINEMKRKHEHAVRVQEVQSILYGWEGEDLTTFGELVLEDTFRMSGAKGHRHVFLFEKGIIIAKKKEDGTLNCKASILCSNLMLIESIPKEPLSFHVIPFDNPKMQYTLQAKSLEQKRYWCLEIKHLILENYNAVIPAKAKELVMMLGKSKEEDAANIENVDPVKKHYSAPEYLEKRKTRRKSGNLIPDFSLLRSQRAKKGTRKSIDMTSSPKSSPPTPRRSLVDQELDERSHDDETAVDRQQNGADLPVEEEEVMVIKEEEAKVTLRPHQRQRLMTERPCSQSLENLFDSVEEKMTCDNDNDKQASLSDLRKTNSCTSYDDSSVRAKSIGKLLDSQGLEAGSRNGKVGWDHNMVSSVLKVASVKRAESFRIATELNRVDSNMFRSRNKKKTRDPPDQEMKEEKGGEEEKKDRAERSEKRNSVEKMEVDSEDEDGYVNIVFGDGRIQFGVDPDDKESLYSNVIVAPKNFEEEVYGDYIKLEKIGVRNLNIKPSKGKIITNQHARSRESVASLEKSSSRNRVHTDTELDILTKEDIREKTRAARERFFSDVTPVNLAFGSEFHKDVVGIRDDSSLNVNGKTTLEKEKLRMRSQSLHSNVLLRANDEVDSADYDNLSPALRDICKPAECHHDTPQSTGSNSPVLGSPLNRKKGVDIVKRLAPTGGALHHDPWIKKAETRANKLKDSSKPLSKFVQRSNSLSSVEDLLEEREKKSKGGIIKGNSQEISESLVFMNKNALVSPKLLRVKHSADQRRQIMRYGTPPRDDLESAAATLADRHKQQAISRLGTPPRCLMDPQTLNDSVVISNSYSSPESSPYHFKYPYRDIMIRSRSANSSPIRRCDNYDYNRPERPQTFSSDGSSGGRDMWNELQNYVENSPEASAVPRFPLYGDLENRPTSVHSNLSAGASYHSQLSSPSFPTSPTSSTTSNESIVGSLKSAVVNITSKISNWTSRTDLSPTRLRTKSVNTIQEEIDEEEIRDMKRGKRRTKIVYELTHAYNSRVNKDKDKQGSRSLLASSSVARQISALLNKQGSSVGARMANAKPFVLGTYTLQRQRPPRPNKDSKQANDSSSDGNQSSREATPEKFSEEREPGQRDSTDSGAPEDGASPPISGIYENFLKDGFGSVEKLPLDALSTKNFSTSSTCGTEDDASSEKSDSYYEKRLSQVLEHGLFRDSAVYSDFDIDGAEQTTATHVPVKETVKQLEEKSKPVTPEKDKLKKTIKSQGILERLKTLEENAKYRKEKSEVLDDIPVRSVKDRALELVELASSEKCPSTPGSVSDTDAEPAREGVVEEVSSRPGWVKEMITKLQTDGGLNSASDA